MSWGVAFLRYGRLWRDSRRAFQHDFHLEGVKHFRPIEELATHRFLANLLHKPDDFISYLRQSVCTVSSICSWCLNALSSMAGDEIIKIAYGIDVKPENDPFIATAEHAVNAISATTNAGSYLVDILPFRAQTSVASLYNIYELSPQ